MESIASLGPAAPQTGRKVIAGLPVAAWSLMLVSVGLGLSIEVAFFVRHRRRRRMSASPAGSGAPMGRADGPDEGPGRPSSPGAPEPRG